MSDTDKEIDGRVRALEIRDAAQRIQTDHIDQTLSELKESVKKLAEEVSALRKTRDQTSGVFRVVVLFVSAAIAGGVSFLVNKVS